MGLGTVGRCSLITLIEPVVSCGLSVRMVLEDLRLSSARLLFDYRLLVLLWVDTGWLLRELSVAICTIHGLLVGHMVMLEVSRVF